MARQIYLPSDPEKLLQIFDNLESDYSDDEFDGYIDDDEEIQERMTRVGEIGSGLEDGETGEGREDLVNVSGGNAVGGSSEDADGSIGMEVDLRGSGSGSDDGSDSGAGDGNLDGGNGNLDGNGILDGGDGSGGRDYSDVGEGSDGSLDGGDGSASGDGSSTVIPTFSEKVGGVPDMSEKEPVDYYQLFISDSILDALEETSRYGQQYVELHQDHLTNHPRARPHDFIDVLTRVSCCGSSCS